jgi:hypothetical protein
MTDDGKSMLEEIDKVMSEVCTPESINFHNMTTKMVFDSIERMKEMLKHE